MELKALRIPNVFISTDGRKIYTNNLVPGTRVYNEDLVDHNDAELRHWNPYRSKLAALLLNDPGHIEVGTDSKILYLGAAAGTTASHVSDIAASGRLYCIEFSERPFRDLVLLCRVRPNMVPVLASARKPAEYNHIVEKVDLVYQDISQRDQVDIFIKNVKMYLKSTGSGILMLKSRSINVNAQPEKIYDEVRTRLKIEGYKSLNMKLLKPYQKDHAAFMIKYN